MVKNLTVSCSKEIKIDKRKIHRLVKEIKTDLNFKIKSFDINFVSSEDIILLNYKYLGHNYSTDIITFNYSGEYLNFDGEIFISVEDAKKNAKIFNVSFDNELVRLIIHGILHMLGYDDRTKNKRNEMKKMEDEMVNAHQKYYRKLAV